MNQNDSTSPTGTPAAHWGATDPASQPDRDAVLSLPRMVLEARLRLGPDVTPEQVAEELRGRGVDTTVEAVRDVWDEGHQDG